MEVQREARKRNRTLSLNQGIKVLPMYGLQPKLVDEKRRTTVLGWQQQHLRFQVHPDDRFHAFALSYIVTLGSQSFRLSELD